MKWVLAYKKRKTAFVNQNTGIDLMGNSQYKFGLQKLFIVTKLVMK